MILERTRLLLLLALLPAPAWAQYRRTGLLNWSFDDLTVNSGAGRVHASQWGQSYKLNLDGPLVLPVLGMMRDGFTYSDGASVSQAVNTGIPHQQTTEFSAAADLFSPRVQRFFRVSPSYSHSYIHQEGQTQSGAYANTVVSNGWGVVSGLSLPFLPAFNYSRQESTQRDPSDLTPLRQRTTTEGKSADYFYGHLTMHAGQQTQRTDDLLGKTGPSRTDFKQAWIEENLYQPKWARLQSFYFRADASENDTNGLTGSKQASSSLGLSTLRFKTAAWESSVTYGANASRDFVGGRRSLSERASLNSTRGFRTGKLSNALNLTQSADAPSVGAGDLLGLTRPLWRKRVTMSLTGSGGVSRSPAVSSLSDGLSARLEFFPSRPRTYFTEAATSEVKFLRGSGGSRVDRYSAGANDRFNTRNLTARLDRTLSRNYAAGSTAVSDQLSLEASGSPTPKLRGSGGYSLGVIRQQGLDAVNQNLHGTLSYEPWPGATLFAAATYANLGVTASATAAYRLGKTSLQLSYEYRRTTTPATYSRLGVSLTRYL